MVENQVNSLVFTNSMGIVCPVVKAKKPKKTDKGIKQGKHEFYTAEKI